MKPSLKPGLEFEFSYLVPEEKTVPHLFPEAPEFQLMPRVLATAYMIGLVEWTCTQALNPHLDWPREMTVGTHVNLSHVAATPPGLVVTVKVKLIQIKDRRLSFEVSAADEFEIICQGTHERVVVDAQRFNDNLTKKIHTGHK